MLHPISLIQLTSEQTLQNVLPALAIKPAHIVQLVTQKVKHRQARFFRDALNVANANYPVRDVELSAMPDVAETQSAIASAITEESSSGFTPVLNLTGGTKLMAIGAYQAALAAGIPAFYFDTEFERLRIVIPHPDFQPPDFQAVAKYLSFKLMLAAHGKPPETFKTSAPPSPALIRFAHISFTFRSDPTNESILTQWLATLRKMVRRDNNRVPSGKSKLKELLETPLPPNPPPLIFMESAAAAGLIRNVDNEWFLNCRPVRSEVERTANLLGGSWLEAFVYDVLSRSARFRDPQWSFEPARINESGWGEIDVACVDSSRLCFVLCSCKTSLIGDGELNALVSARESANQLGGKFARAILCIFRHHNPEQLKKRAEALNVELFTGYDIERNLKSQIPA